MVQILRLFSSKETRDQLLIVQKSLHAVDVIRNYFHGWAGLVNANFSIKLIFLADLALSIIFFLCLQNDE